MAKITTGQGGEEMNREAWEKRHSRALDRIGYQNLLALPDPIKAILKGNYSMEVKTKMLEAIADAMYTDMGGYTLWARLKGEIPASIDGRR